MYKISKTTKRTRALARYGSFAKMAEKVENEYGAEQIQVLDGL